MKKNLLFFIVFFGLATLGCASYLFFKWNSPKILPEKIPVTTQKSNEVAQTPENKVLANNSLPRWKTIATHQNWQIRCRDGSSLANKNLCIGVVEVVNTKTHQLLLAWLVGQNANGKLTSTLTLPTGVKVAPGVDLQFDSEANYHIDYSACRPQNCEATTTMSEKLVRDAMDASKAKITVYSADGKAISFTIPIGGFKNIATALQ